MTSPLPTARVLSIALRRPVSVSAAALVVLALGAVALVRLPVTLLPELAYPALVVWTAYPDVPPEQVERALTEPLEQALAGTPGLRRLDAQSRLGGSLHALRFGWAVSLDAALLDVRERLDRQSATLPPGAERPVVLRSDPSRRPVLTLAAATEHGTLVREVVARRLEQVDGVARVTVVGSARPTLVVEPETARLAALGLSLDAVEMVLGAANVRLPGGTLREGPYRYTVEVDGRLSSAGSVADLVVARTERGTVRLGDVARVRPGTEPERGAAHLNGARVTLLDVERRPDANTVRVAAAVHQTLAELHDELPGVPLTMLHDASVEIRAAIRYVAGALLLGAVLALLSLRLFVRDGRVLAAVAASVPLSLALALALFDALGVTLNLISLGGLALGVGLLVDNAVVVAESVARRRELGDDAWTAARDGTAEVAGAITAGTLTTAVVFLPITFVEGLGGRLFGEQALAIVSTLGASLVVALTVVPLVLSRARGPSVPTPRAARRLQSIYDVAVTPTLARPGRVAVGALALVLLGGALAWTLPRAAVPADPGDRLAVRLTLPPDASLARLEAETRTLARYAEALPGVAFVLAELGEPPPERLDLTPRPPYAADLIVHTDRASLPRTAEVLRRAPLPPEAGLTVQPVASDLARLLDAGEAELVIELGADHRALLDGPAEALAARLAEVSALRGVRPADGRGVPLLRVLPDRDRMARLGVSQTTVLRHIEAATGGRTATLLYDAEGDRPVRLDLGPHSRERLLALRIPTAGGSVPLAALVRLETAEQPDVLLRAGQRPVVRWFADRAPGPEGRRVEQAVAEAGAALPPGVRVRLGGDPEAFRDSLRAVGWSLLLSALLVYLILVVQFESVRRPLVVLASLPLAGLGVVLGLTLTGHSLNLMSLTGAALLVGLVVNDAILKVTFADERLRAGVPLREALHRAGRDRLRPIVVTTLTTVFGMLPLALGLGEGAATRVPLAVAVIGGLLAASLLSLFVTPALYQLLYRRPQADTSYENHLFGDSP